MRHSSTCVDNTIIYLGIQYSRKCALGTPWIFVILAIWTSTWIIFLSRASPNKRGFQSYNKRCAFFLSFKGSYRGFIALKEIQIRFATVQILNRGGSAAMWWREAEGGGRASGEAVAPSRHQMAAEVFTWHPAAWAVCLTCTRFELRWGKLYWKPAFEKKKKKYWEVIMIALQNYPFYIILFNILRHNQNHCSSIPLK